MRLGLWEKEPLGCKKKSCSSGFKRNPPDTRYERNRIHVSIQSTIIMVHNNTIYKTDKKVGRNEKEDERKDRQQEETYFFPCILS